MAKSWQKLTRRYGYFFEVSVPTSFAATVEEMCASPDNTMGFIPAKPYVLGVNFVVSMWLLPPFGTDSKSIGLSLSSDVIAALKKLKTRRKKWAFPDAASTSGYTVPSVMFKKLGIKVGEEVQAGGHNQAVKAVYNGEADFATVFYSAFRTPEGVSPWKYGDPPDIPEDLIDFVCSH